MSKLDNNDLDFFNHLGQHIGLLVVEYVRLGGKEAGSRVLQSCSGCFFVLDDKWYFVTVGHVFHRDDGRVGFKQAVERNAIRVTRAFLADYFGPGAKPHGSGPGATHIPTDIDFAEVLANTVYLNDDVRGLDFAFIPLRDFYVASVQANGVVPLTEAGCQPSGQAEKYLLVGFPDEEKTPTSADASESPSVRPCYARMDSCDLPDKYTKPTLPYLAAQLPVEGPVSPVGFSGSPIFGLRVSKEEGKTYYWLAAIDYKWHKDDRIIVGCTMPVVIAEARRLIAARRPAPGIAPTS